MFGKNAAKNGLIVPASPNDKDNARIRQYANIIKILNKKPLLYLTLGGVIASGIPINTSTIVVSGNANLSNKSIINTRL